MISHLSMWTASGERVPVTKQGSTRDNAEKLRTCPERVPDLEPVFVHMLRTGDTSKRSVSLIMVSTKTHVNPVFLTERNEISERVPNVSLCVPDTFTGTVSRVPLP